MSRTGVRFKSVRIGLDNVHSLQKGWLFRFSKLKNPFQIPSDWHCIADFPTGIRWRPELGEINENRIHNMNQCAASIDGLLLKPGAAFSLRKSIGEPIPERGFKSGPTIIRGQLHYTSGGGICQVSTTLFNAALVGNLDILQKYNHSADIWGEQRFIDLGRDAVFVYARRDLKFRNPHHFPICLKMWVDQTEPTKQKLCCQVWAPEKLDYSVQVSTEILDSWEPESNGSQDANRIMVKGWKVRTLRECHFSNGKSESDYDSESIYEARWRKA